MKRSIVWYGTKVISKLSVAIVIETHFEVDIVTINVDN